jgi:hypothetical protein
MKVKKPKLRKPRNPLIAEMRFKEEGRHGVKVTNKQLRAQDKERFRRSGEEDR